MGVTEKINERMFQNTSVCSATVFTRSSKYTRAANIAMEVVFDDSLNLPKIPLTKTKTTKQEKSYTKMKISLHEEG